MPLYWFHLDVDAPPQIVAARIRAVVANEKSFFEFRSWWSRDPDGRPFRGVVEDDCFRVRRYISYHNSFLPIMRGRLVPISAGTRLNVVMFIHPLVTLFMILWLGIAGWGAFDVLSAVTLWGMFLFGVALTVGGFFPEVFKAKRLVSEALQDMTVTMMRQGG